ncbi:hypothetical protein [Sphingomonas humi]|uniref:Uncharacterized protein n=1 Tax=Sphingomonas humi TaxID=335630 RepID=A0ABP7RHX7_9SPHN
MIRRTLIYGAFIALVAAAVWWWEGARTPEPRNLVAALVLLPVFAWLIWLRRQWAPEQARRREAERSKRGGAAPGHGASDIVTDEAERP